jgi:DNA modification methylase
VGNPAKQINRINPTLAPLVRPLATIRADPNNVKKHGRRSLDEIARSLELHGQQKPVVVLPDGTAIAGSGTIEAARKLGWTELAVVTWNGSAARARAYAVSDNRSAEFADWDDVQLSKVLGEIASEGLRGDDIGFTDRELADLLGAAAGGGGATDDDIPPPPETAITQPGDVWLLGENRLMCGDSTSVEAVAALLAGEKARQLITDPPWNVDLENYVSTKRISKTRENNHIANDALGADFPEWCRRVCAVAAGALAAGAPAYVVMSSQEWPVIDGALRTAGFHWSSTIIWLKDRPVLGRKDYHEIYEPVWYGWREGGPRLVELHDRTQTTVWPVKRPGRSDLHPTTKPLELIDRMVRNSSRRGDVVLDLFGGSGSTLIAADAAGRRGYAMELSPNYCDVIVQRWEKATGAKAVRG